MSQSSLFGIPDFDPSKMDPKLMMKLSQIVQQLPSEQLSRMQTLMHNAMAGFDVSKEIEEFEKNLPSGLREKLMSLMGGSSDPLFAVPRAKPSVIKMDTSEEGNHLANLDMKISEARITVLRAVADGRISPEDAEKLLFKE